MKNISLTVIDDDGNSTSAILQVNVINQRPVAVFSRPADGNVDTTYTFTNTLFDPDGDSSQLSTLWTISDLDDPIENVSSGQPHIHGTGTLHGNSCHVTDVLGLESAQKSFTLRIENPFLFQNRLLLPNVDDIILDREPEDGEQVIWQVPQTEEGGAFVSPGSLMKFDIKEL